MLSKPARTKLYFVLLALCNLCVFLREAHSVTMTLPHCHLQVRQRTEQNPLSEMHNQRWIFLEYKFYNTCSFGTLAYFRACRTRCVLLLEIFHSCTKAEVDPEQQLNPDLLYPQKKLQFASQVDFEPTEEQSWSRSSLSWQTLRHPAHTLPLKLLPAALSDKDTESVIWDVQLWF